MFLIYGLRAKHGIRTLAYVIQQVGNFPKLTVRVIPHAANVFQDEICDFFVGCATEGYNKSQTYKKNSDCKADKDNAG